MGSVGFGQGYAPNNRLKIGSWNLVNVKLEVTPKLNIFAESQLRSQEFINAINYWEAKAFFHYKVGETTWLGMGAGTYHQYQNYRNFSTPQSQKEFRAWAEGFQKVTNGRFIFEHRYRAEYRLIGKYNVGTDDFVVNTGSNGADRFRFRYRLQTFVPLNHKTMAPKTIFFNASDELMFTNSAPFYSQNRLFAGAGYKFNAKSQVMVGLMHQWNRSNTAITLKNYVQVTFATVLKTKRMKS